VVLVVPVSVLKALKSFFAKLLSYHLHLTLRPELNRIKKNNFSILSNEVKMKLNYMIC